MKIPLLKFRYILKDFNVIDEPTDCLKMIYVLPRDSTSDTHVILHQIINDKRLAVGLDKDLNISYALLTDIPPFLRPTIVGQKITSALAGLILDL